MEPHDTLTKRLGQKLVEHEPMKQHTTMYVGGVADYYYQADTVEELIKAVQAAVDVDMPYFVLGGGSNVIASDYGFPGLIIANRASNIAFLTDKSQAIVDSGVFLAHLITKAAAHELGGLEFLAGIPGTVGGAAYNNASCWGGTIGDYVKSITVLIPGEEPGEKCRVRSIEGEGLNFDYHGSRLKEAAKRQEGRKPVILSVKLQMSHIWREEIMRRLQQYQQMRMERQPVGVHSAGSIFKNPSGEASNPQTGGKDPKLSAGYLIDAVGGKKLRIGDAMVSKKHANFVINNGKATAVDLRGLIEKLRDLVREKHGVLLEEEVEYLGRWPETTVEE